MLAIIAIYVLARYLQDLAPDQDRAIALVALLLTLIYLVLFFNRAAFIGP